MHGTRRAAEHSSRLSFRDLIGNPFVPERRAIVPAITTLTIRLRRHPLSPPFLLHWRDPARVATAGGTYDVIPAASFSRHRWRSGIAALTLTFGATSFASTQRNCSARRSTTAPDPPPIDYDAWPLYRGLDQALTDSTLSAHLLGLGVDALTLAATILSVVVIDDDVFERAFGEAVRYNEEGEIVAIGGGRGAEGIPFTQAALRGVCRRSVRAAGGRARRFGATRLGISVDPAASQQGTRLCR